MINNYRLALRLLAFLAISFVATIVLMGGSQEDIEWGAPSQIEVPTYAETLTKGLDCDTDGALPEVAIVTYRDKVAAVKVTDPVKVGAAIDFALGGEKDPNIIEVNALCIR